MCFANKVRKKLRQNFFNSIINSINNTDPRMSKQFWNNLKHVKSKDQKGGLLITKSEWQKHYKQFYCVDIEPHREKDIEIDYKIIIF